MVARLCLILSLVFLKQTSSVIISDKRRCADPHCSVLIAAGRTTGDSVGDNGLLSYSANQVVHILSKEWGENLDLWGVVIGDRRGYMNKADVKVDRVYREDLPYIVPTELGIMRERERFQRKKMEASKGNAGFKSVDDLVDDLDNMLKLKTKSNDEKVMTTQSPISQPEMKTFQEVNISKISKDKERPLVPQGSNSGPAIIEETEDVVKLKVDDSNSVVNSGDTAPDLSSDYNIKSVIVDKNKVDTTPEKKEERLANASQSENFLVMNIDDHKYNKTLENFGENEVSVKDLSDNNTIKLKSNFSNEENLYVQGLQTNEKASLLDTKEDTVDSKATQGRSTVTHSETLDVNTARSTGSPNTSNSGGMTSRSDSTGGDQNRTYPEVEKNDSTGTWEGTTTEQKGNTKEPVIDSTEDKTDQNNSADPTKGSFHSDNSADLKEVSNDHSKNVTMENVSEPGEEIVSETIQKTVQHPSTRKYSNTTEPENKVTPPMSIDDEALSLQQGTNLDINIKVASKDSENAERTAENSAAGHGEENLNSDTNVAQIIENQPPGLASAHSLSEESEYSSSGHLNNQLEAETLLSSSPEVLISSLPSGQDEGVITERSFASKDEKGIAVDDEKKENIDNDIADKVIQDKSKEHQNNDSNSFMDSKETPSQQSNNVEEDSVGEASEERGTAVKQNTVMEASLHHLAENFTDNTLNGDQIQNDDELMNSNAEVVSDSDSHQKNQLNNLPEKIIIMDDQDTVTEEQEAQEHEVLAQNQSVVDTSIHASDAQLHSGHKDEDSIKPADVKQDSNKPADAKEDSIKSVDAKQDSNNPSDAKEDSNKPADAKEDSNKPADAKEDSSKPADAKEDLSIETPGPVYPGGVGHNHQQHPSHAYQQGNSGHNIHPRSIQHPSGYAKQHNYNRQQSYQYTNTHHHHGPHHAGYQQGRPTRYNQQHQVQPGYPQQYQHQQMHQYQQQYHVHPRYQNRQEQLDGGIPVTEKSVSTTIDVIASGDNSGSSQGDLGKSNTSRGDSVESSTVQAVKNLEKKDLPVLNGTGSLPLKESIREILQIYSDRLNDKFQSFKTSVELQVPEELKESLSIYSDLLNDMLQLFKTSVKRQVPLFLHYTGFQLDRFRLVFVVAMAILLVHLINLCLDQAKKKAPMLSLLKVLEAELSSSNMKVVDMHSKINTKEIEDKMNKVKEVKKLEEKLTECREEMQSVLEQVRLCDEKIRTAESYLSQKTRELISLEGDNKIRLEKINNLNTNKNNQELNQEIFKKSFDKLKKELGDYKEKKNEYEMMSIKNNMEIKDITLQLQAIEKDVKNANIEKEKIEQEIHESSQLKNELVDKIELIVANENEWNGLTDLLNEQMENTCKDIEKLNQELPIIQTNLSSFESRYAGMVDEEEILRESLDTLQDDVEKYTEADGWEINDVSLIIDKTESILQLKHEIERAATEKESIESELSRIIKKSELLKSEVSLSNSIIEDLEKKKVYEEALCSEAQCKMEVFTELFNKKEAELQKQLGQQVALFGEINEDSAGSLEKVSLELEDANNQLRITKEKLQKCGKEFKAKVSEKEATAHANWVDAKREEKRLQDLEEEFKILKNRLLVSASSEPGGQSDLPTLPGMSSQIPTLPGTHAMLPPLPGMPSMPVIPSVPSLPGMPSLPSDLPSLIGMPSTLTSLPNITGYLPSLPGMPMPSSANNMLSLFTPSKQPGMPETPQSTGVSGNSLNIPAMPDQYSYTHHFTT